MSKLRKIVIAAAALVVVPVALVALTSAAGGYRARRSYEQEKEALLRRAREATPRPFDAAAVQRLPEPLQRYLHATGASSRSGFRAAIVKQTGAIRTGYDKPWMPLEAEQVYSVDPPGFLWLANARMAPLIGIWARDAFVDGRGNMLIRLLGAFTVADGRGPEMDQGAGLRFWGEIISFPEMVTDPHLQWEPIDSTQAKLRIKQGELQLEATIAFDGRGLPVAMHAQRYRDVDGKAVLTPWSGHMSDWRMIDGRLFPAHWESIWHTPEGDLLAVKLDIVGVRVE